MPYIPPPPKPYIPPPPRPPVYRPPPMQNFHQQQQRMFQQQQFQRRQQEQQRMYVCNVYIRQQLASYKYYYWVHTTLHKLTIHNYVYIPSQHYPAVTQRLQFFLCKDMPPRAYPDKCTSNKCLRFEITLSDEIITLCYQLFILFQACNLCVHSSSG